MSMSTSLSNALSGLNAAARAADLVSSNVANALTAGYARRTLQLSSKSLAGNGAGVQVDGVIRQVDQAVLAERRTADAALSGRAVISGFLTGYEAAIGTPDQANSLSGRIAGFEQALLTAASRPDIDQRLTGVLRAAQDLTGQLGAMSGALQSARGEADRQIARDVATVNDALVRIEDLNTQITVSLARGADATALMDQRQLQVDRISPLVPIREVARDRGQIALYTANGASLIDGKAAVLGFIATNAVTPDMTQASGALSGLTINGRAIPTIGDDSQIAGGAIAANFAVRDTLAVNAQTELDALARDLVERFESPAADATLTPGLPGLFTDAGAVFDPLVEVGLSARLGINELVDPDQGGALRLLRDGLGGFTAGPVGDATQLNALTAVLQSLRPPASGLLFGQPHSFSGLGAALLTAVGSDRQVALADESYDAARHDAITRSELENGVDSDQELQSLLLIEQAYTANARVIQTVDDMIRTILGI